MSKIIGIDLGTTNSAVAVVENGSPKILENSEGARTTPSVVAISKTRERLVGQLAKRQAVTNPENTIHSIKRFIGHDFDDEVVQRDKKTVSYEISKSESGGVEVKMGDKKYRSEEISAMILKKLKEDAEAKLGQKVTEAVITVPAYFNDNQRKATQAAGKIAGLEVKRIINEPTAAALAYGFDKKKNEKIVVYDFGGGTFDVSVLTVGDDEGEFSAQVESTDGDSHMGGKDIDQKIIHYLADQFKKDSGIDILKDRLALQRLDEAAEKAKHELSNASETEVNIPFITSDASGPKHLLIKMTRAILEDLASEYIDKSIEITKKAVEASGIKLEEIDEIILVGGQTRMPKIAERVKELFGKEPNKSINPDEVVALGAALQGAVLSGDSDVKDVLLLDVIPLSLGIETLGGVATKVIERNTHIPASKSQTFSTAADNQTSVEVNVVQGERPMAADNKSLGRFVLDGIPPSPRGVPQVEVTFDIDKDGVLNVSAKEKTTGKEQSIKIEASSGLSEEEIEKMKADAEKHSEEDKKKKEVIEARNTAEQLVYTAEKSLKDNEGKIPEEIKKAVEEKVATLKKARDGEDLEAIKKSTEELSNELSKIGEHMQANQQPKTDSDQADPGQAGNQQQDGNVRDAQYEEGGSEEKKDQNQDGEDKKAE